MGFFGRKKTDEELRDEKVYLERKIKEESLQLTKRAERRKLESDIAQRKSSLEKVRSSARPQSFGSFMVDGIGRVAKVGGEVVKQYGEAQERPRARIQQRHPQMGFNTGNPFADPFAPKRRRK